MVWRRAVLDQSESRARSRSVTSSRPWPMDWTSHGWSRPPTTVVTRRAGKTPRARAGAGPDLPPVASAGPAQAVRPPATARAGSGEQGTAHARQYAGLRRTTGPARAAQKVWSGPGKVPALDVLVVGPRRAEQLAVEVGVLLDEGGHPAGAQAEGVVPDQHLAVALDAGADADGRDHQLLGDLRGDVAGHHLHHDRERAGVLDGVGVGEDPLGRVAAALDAVAAEGVLALRGEADVGHHRDAALAEPGDLRRHLDAALELHAVGEALLHEAAAVA